MCANKQASIKHIAEQDKITPEAAKKKYEELRASEDYKHLTPEQMRQVVTGEKTLDDFKRGNASRPGGYVVGDVDKHGLLSPGENRADGNHNVKAENQIQSHHPVQDEWAKRWAKKNNIAYDRNESAAILLPSNSGMSHAKISAAQRARRRIEGFDTSIEHEFNVGYRELIDAGGVSLTKQISNSNHQIDERTVQKLEKKAMEALGKQILSQAIKDKV